jgi:hypothetical protein
MVERRITTMAGGECVLGSTAIGALASELRGDLIAIDHSDYDTVRKVWNESTRSPH